MRHFLHQRVGPALPLPRCVLARPLGRALVGGTRATHRLTTADRTAVSGAIDLPPIALAADVHLPIAPCAWEEPLPFVDHRDLRR
jgi:hypothetical protein